ncbi:LysR family transcriptional regulator substrate-binding protein, partial [Actinokineospora sp.]|uniref:LysR family transcriptional regulator substrate-binding protein n=1 Tax=Actinokineospora sp. TaxID=1872133 RepID=UPI003D6B1C3B
LRIAAPPTTVSDLVAPFIATFGAGDPFPAVRPESARGAYEALAHGAADVAVSPDPPPAGHASALVATFPIWLYVPADHGWAHRESVGLGELADAPLLVLPETYTQRQLLDQASAAAGIVLSGARETSSPEVAQALAAAGWGAALVSDDSRFGLRGLRVATTSGDLSLRLHAAWDRDHHGAAEIGRIVARLREFCRDRYGSGATVLT